MNSLKLDDDAYRDVIEAELFVAAMTRREQGDKVVGVESYSLGQFIRDELEVPFLQIETDYSDSDTGWLQVRVEAFVEML